MNQQPFPFDYYRTVFDDFSRINQLSLLNDICDAIAIHLPACIESYDLLSFGYFKAKEYHKSLEWGNRALAASPNPQIACAVRSNLNKSLMCVNQPEQAAKYIEENLKYNPQNPDALIDLSVALYAANKKSQAGEILRDLQKNIPRSQTQLHQTLNFNLGIHEIAQGNFRQGLKQISSGRDIKVWGNYTHNFPVPEWRGQQAPGKKLLVVGEGGAGDEIINARFIHHLTQRGMEVHWASAHGLASLFTCLPAKTTQNYKNFTSEISNIRDFDYWCPAMSLAVYLDADVGDLWQGAYISVSNQQQQQGADILARHSQIANINVKIPRVGIRWSGNPHYDHDLHRTVDFTNLWDQLKHLPCDYYSLQRDTNLQDLAYTSGAVSDLSPDLVNWETTAAVISQLDVVVTSCTSIAHLAAAMDKPTIVMVPVLAYYIWPENLNSTYWYSDRVHVVHQNSPRAWQDVTATAANILKSLIKD
jgi:tetratricopeptide (TPR) repeat protein